MEAHHHDSLIVRTSEGEGALIWVATPAAVHLSFHEFLDLGAKRDKTPPTLTFSYREASEILNAMEAAASGGSEGMRETEFSLCNARGDVRLGIVYANRGEPFREGVEMTLDAPGISVYGFLDKHGPYGRSGSSCVGRLLRTRPCRMKWGARPVVSSRVEHNHKA